MQAEIEELRKEAENHGIQADASARDERCCKAAADRLQDELDADEETEFDD